MPALGINPFPHSKHLLSYSKTLISSQFQTSTGQYVVGMVSFNPNKLLPYILFWMRSLKLRSHKDGVKRKKLFSRSILVSLSFNGADLLDDMAGRSECVFWTIIGLNDMAYD